MTKSSIAPLRQTNQPVYPDVLGMITGGARSTVDLLQVAIAARPAATNAGKPFDVIVLLQNTSNIEIDAVMRLIVPDKDLAGKVGRFTTTLHSTVRIGLRPGEVGYANLPILIGHQAAPGAGYTAQVELVVEHKGRAPIRVRGAEGGTYFSLDEADDEKRAIFQAVMGLEYSTDTVGKGRTSLPVVPTANRATLLTQFEVLPAAIAGLPTEIKPGYVTLWTDADFRDPAWLAHEAKPLTDKLLPQLGRANVFFPLLRATQARFDAAGYRLWAGEAVLIAKLLTLMLEMGGPITIAGQDQPRYPRWFVKLCRMLLRRPALAGQIPTLVADHLYPELIHDAAMFGFTMLGTVTSEEFGSDEEIERYVERLLTGLMNRGDAIDLSRAWLPLVLAGLVSNTRVTMPHEIPKETARLFLRARERRANEQDEHTQFLFAMADDLLDRAIEHF